MRSLLLTQPPHEKTPKLFPWAGVIFIYLLIDPTQNVWDPNDRFDEQHQSSPHGLRNQPLGVKCFRQVNAMQDYDAERHMMLLVLVFLLGVILVVTALLS